MKIPEVGSGIILPPSECESFTTDDSQRLWPKLVVCNPASVWRVISHKDTSEGQKAEVELVRHFWPMTHDSLEEGFENGSGI